MTANADSRQDAYRPQLVVSLAGKVTLDVCLECILAVQISYPPGLNGLVYTPPVAVGLDPLVDVPGPKARSPGCGVRLDNPPWPDIEIGLCGC